MTEEMAITPYGDDIDLSLFGGGDKLSENASQGVMLPRLAIVTDNSKFSKAGGEIGEWAVMFDDGSVLNLGKVIRFWKVDNVGGRALWAYNAQTGKRLNADEISRHNVDMLFCGSNNHTSPRSNYITDPLTTYIDPRQGDEIAIVKDGCANCKLAQWRSRPKINPVTMKPELNADGTPVTESAPPLCNEQPNMVWVIWTPEWAGPVVYQAKGTALIFLKGFTNKSKYGKKYGARRGVDYYFENAGRELFDYGDGGKLVGVYPMEAAVLVDDNNAYDNDTFVPNIYRSPTALEGTDFSDLQNFLREYKERDMRTWLQGEKREVSSEVEETPSGEVQNPF